MTTDVATLAIAIDSRQARTAGQDLQQFQRTARTTEQSAGKLTAANQNLSQSFRNTAGSIAVMHGPLGGVASRFSAMGMLIGRMGLAMGSLAVGIGAVTFAAQRGVRAFADYERQLLTTEQVIRATGGSAGRTVADIEALSRQIGAATLASAQQVREASNMLLTFRSIAGDTFDRTLHAAQDLAAAGFGSVTSATQQLARALEDPAQGLTMLRRVGVSFSASQIEVIKNLHETGRVAEAQNQILKQVEQQVGGAGAAAGGGLAGAFDNLAEATADWFILIGDNMSNLLRLPDVFNAIGNSMRSTNEHMRASGIGGFLSQSRQQIEENLALIARLEGGQQTSGILGRIRQLEMENEAIQANIDEVERFGRAQQRVTDARSRAAQEQMRADRFDAEMIRQERDAAELRLTELQKQIGEAQRRAGVDPSSPGDAARAAEIERQVTANFRLAESIKAIKDAEDDREKARQSVVETTDALRDELAVLRASDPVKARMIELSRELSAATADEAREVRKLVAEIELETAAKQEQDARTRMIESLRTQIAVMRETDPVQKELIRRHKELAGASDEERAAITRLIAERERLNRMGSHRGPLDFRTNITGIHTDFRTSVAGTSGGGANALTQASMTQAVSSAVKPPLSALQSSIVRTLDGGFRDLDSHGRSIVSHAGRTADGLHSVNASVDSSGDRITGAIGLQTGELTSAFRSGFQAITNASTSTTMSTGFATTPGGLADRALGGFESSIRLQQDSLSAEAQTLQTALQFKQLTTEQTAEAEMRLAEISLENAKLGERLADAQRQLADGLGRMAQSLINPNADSFQHFATARAATAAGQTMGAGSGSIDLQELVRMIRGMTPGMMPRFADGVVGFRGSGGARTDSNVVRISNGESVINERSTSRNAGALDTINRDRGRTSFDLLPRFADGDVPGIRMPEQRAAGATDNSQSHQVDRSVHIGQIMLASDGGGGRGQGSMRQQARDVGRIVGQYR